MTHPSECASGAVGCASAWAAASEGASHNHAMALPRGHHQRAAPLLDRTLHRLDRPSPRLLGVLTAAAVAPMARPVKDAPQPPIGRRAQPEASRASVCEPGLPGSKWDGQIDKSLSTMRVSSRSRTSSSLRSTVLMMLAAWCRGALAPIDWNKLRGRAPKTPVFRALNNSKFCFMRSKLGGKSARAVGGALSLQASSPHVLLDSET